MSWHGKSSVLPSVCDVEVLWSCTVVWVSFRDVVSLWIWGTLSEASVPTPGACPLHTAKKVVPLVGAGGVAPSRLGGPGVLPQKMTNTAIWCIVISVHMPPDPTQLMAV